MTTSTATKLKAAIDHSELNNEIVHITIDGDSGDALTAINTLVDCETDYAMADHEGVDTMDVWGFDEDAPAGQMRWRLAIRFADRDGE